MPPPPPWVRPSRGLALSPVQKGPVHSFCHCPPFTLSALFLRCSSQFLHLSYTVRSGAVLPAAREKRGDCPALTRQTCASPPSAAA